MQPFYHKRGGKNNRITAYLPYSPISKSLSGLSGNREKRETDGNVL
nr:MAG TPA: hypothetical protein [Caudoviricetes sp.]